MSPSVQLSLHVQNILIFCYLINLSVVVWNWVNADSSLKFNPSINFSWIKMSFTAFILWTLRLLKLKTGGNTTCTEKLQIFEIKILTCSGLAI